MSDRIGSSNNGPTPTEALRALPLVQPPRSAWPAIAVQLPPPTRAPLRRRVLGLAALAATLAIALALPVWRNGDVSIPPVETVHTTDSTPASATEHVDPLDALLLESAQLEAWIAWSSGVASESGASASIEMDVRDRIGAIDALLARPALDPAAQLPLLQERVVRLRQLAGLHNTRQLLAANGDDAVAAPVTVF